MNTPNTKPETAKETPEVSLQLPKDITMSRNAAIELMRRGKVNQSQLDTMIHRTRARGKGLVICSNDVDAAFSNA